ncbi:MAG: hypothetical protein ACKPCP_01610 [Sphaerospermopsis kisseleviana]
MKNLRARQQVLINLITRVGGRNNTQKWVDELLKIDWELAAETKENKMFKINVTELHITIQEKLAKLLDGKLSKGFIETGLDPESLNWYALEVAIYGDIDSDSDRLDECVSWEIATPSKDKLELEIAESFSSLEDWHKFQTRGAWHFFGEKSLDAAISSYIFGLDRKYCGQVFKSTGRSKELVTYDQYDGFGFKDSVDLEKSVYTKWEYAHPDGTTIWLTEEKKEHTIPTEKGIVTKIQYDLYEYFKKENLTWEKFVSDIENRKQKNAAFDAAEEAAKKAAAEAIPEPEWCRKQIFYNPKNSRFWIGNKGIWQFNWCTKKGEVVGHYDDRINNTKSVTRLGSDEETVLAFIKAKQDERAEAFAVLHAAKEREEKKQAEYEAYKKAQKAKGGIIKPFEKWLQTAQ